MSKSNEEKIKEYEEAISWIESFVLRNKWHPYYNDWYWQRKKLLEKIDKLKKKRD